MQPQGAASLPVPAPPGGGRSKWIVLSVALIAVVIIVALAFSYLLTPPNVGTSWQSVTSFSGSSDRITDPFTITGTTFRLNWTATADPVCIALWSPNPCPALFSIFVFPEGESALYVKFVLELTFNEVSNETVVDRNGSFYLEISTANLASYSIAVDEWT